jgi:formamidopyrimidine-DNA glycosylase
VPELPEVETVRRGLEPVMTGRVIERAEARRPDLRWPLPARMAERLAGQRVERLRRRSKYLLADLASGETLIVHLGMSGRMLVSLPGGGRDGVVQFVHAHPAHEKHDHVVLDMEGGARITFNDPRRFGAMDLWPTDRLDSHRLLRELGPEPLGNAFDEPWMAGRLAGRRVPMKAALLDQHVVAGLGNIYVCEALWRAGVSPRRKAANLSQNQLRALVPAIRDVLTEAIAAGGSSLRDYRQADGELGYFQHSFAVYGRAGEPCPRPGCGAPIRRVVQSGRSSFYCPKCQR